MNADREARLKAAIRRLADDAVSAGRVDWDSYFGHDNEHHLEDLEKWPAYIDLLKIVGESDE